VQEHAEFSPPVRAPISPKKEINFEGIIGEELE
jgi:hypothetical protein